MEMTDKTTNMLVDTLNDLEEPFSPVMELTAKVLLGVSRMFFSRQQAQKTQIQAFRPQRYAQLSCLLILLKKSCIDKFCVVDMT